MNFNSLVDQAIDNTICTSVPLFGPELVICVTIFVLLATRVLPLVEKIDAFYLALIGLFVALCIPFGGQPWRMLASSDEFARVEIFSGMLVYDGFTVFMRGFLLVFAILLLLLVRLSKVFDRRDGTDIYTLLLGATLGLSLMASANHLLMIFLAVEMASVPSYVLAGMRKDRRLSSEAALKYSIYGAGTAGIMLYGISLVAGVTNTLHLPTVATRLATMWPELSVEQTYVLALGGLMIMIGLAFKLSAVPFHFWCPDVFEGASAEVNAFLSVASKAAALALLVRVVIGVGVIPSTADHSTVALADLPPAVETTFLNVSDEQPGKPSNGIRGVASGPSRAGPAGLRNFMGLLIAVIAAVTCTFGNLAAYGQRNINRLLAYSTIAHAGYMMMAVPPVVAMTSQNIDGAEKAVAALAMYMVIYLFMNLGAFSIVAILRDQLGSEEIADYAGLIRRSPGIAICFAVILFSLVGIPPLAGFIGKFAIFAALVDGWKVSGHGYLMALLIVGGLNTAVSLFYYLRVVRVIAIDPEPENHQSSEGSLISRVQFGYVLLVTIPVVFFFFQWDWLSQLARAATTHLLS